MTETDADYKSVMKSGPSDLRLRNPKIPKISTISNDKSAARWDHFENEDKDTRKLMNSGSADKSMMETIFLRHSMATVDVAYGDSANERVNTKLPVNSKSEEVITRIRYYNDPPGSADMMKNKGMNEEATTDRQSPGAGNVTYNDRENKIEGKRVNVGTSSSAKNEKSLTKSEVLRRMTGAHDSRDTSIEKVITRHFSENSIAQHSTNKGENEIGRELHAKSEENLTNLERGNKKPRVEETTKTTNKNLVAKKTARESSARTKEIFAENDEKLPTVKSNQPNSRSEEFLKKTSFGKTSTSVSKARSDESITSQTMKQTNNGHKLRARSEEGLGNVRPGSKIRHPHFVEKEIQSTLHPRSKENLTNQKTDKKPLTAKSNQLNARSEDFASNKNTKNSPATTAKEKPIEVTTVYHLLARSAEVLNLPRKFQESSKSATELQNLVLDDSALKDGKSKILDSSLSTEDHSLAQRLPEINVGIGSGERSSNQLLNARSNRNILNSEPTAERNASRSHPSQSRPEDKIGRKLYARSNEMLINPNAGSTLEANKINHELFKSSSDKGMSSTSYQDTLGPTLKENTQINEIQLPARSEEFVRIKQRGRTQSNTALEGLEKLRNSGIISGSHSSINRSNDCVDCEGSGYVLRARPSQPCDQCKASLSKYPNFVNALSNQVSPSEDNQRRVVTRTSDDCIKVTWTNKSDEKLITKPDQEKPNEEKLDETKMAGKLTETMNDVAKDKGNTFSPKDMSGSKETSANKAKENTTSTKNLIHETRSLREGHKIVGSNERSVVLYSRKSKETVNCNEKTDNNSSVESVRKVQSVNVSETNDKFEIDSIPQSKSDVPRIFSTPLSGTLVKRQGNDLEHFSMDKTKERIIHKAKSEHLLPARSIETAQNLNDGRRTYNRPRSDEMPIRDEIKESIDVRSESRQTSGTRYDQNLKNEETSSVSNVVSSSTNESQEKVKDKVNEG